MQQQQQQQQQPFNGCHTASPVKNWKDFVGVEFYCPQALADGNQGILVREKTLEFSSTVLSTLFPYLNIMQQINVRS